MIVKVYGDGSTIEMIFRRVRKRRCQVRDCGGTIPDELAQAHMNMYHEGQDASIWSDPFLLDPCG